MAKQRKAWTLSPAKNPKSLPDSLPDSLKADVEAKANNLIEKRLEPQVRRAAPKRAAVQLRHRHRSQVVQELLLLLRNLRLSWTERPVAHVRVEIRQNGTHRQCQVCPRFHASQRRVGWDFRRPHRG